PKVSSTVVIWRPLKAANRRIGATRVRPFLYRPNEVTLFARDQLSLSIKPAASRSARKTSAVVLRTCRPVCSSAAAAVAAMNEDTSRQGFRLVARSALTTSKGELPSSDTPSRVMYFMADWAPVEAKCWAGRRLGQAGASPAKQDTVPNQPVPMPAKI